MHKAGLLIKSDRAKVIAMGCQLHAMKTRTARCRQSRIDQATAKPLASKAVDNAHTQNATMRNCRTFQSTDIAPANHTIIRKRDELRIAVRDHAEHEGMRRL